MWDLSRAARLNQGPGGGRLDDFQRIGESVHVKAEARASQGLGRTVRRKGWCLSAGVMGIVRIVCLGGKLSHQPKTPIVAQSTGTI